MTDRVRQMITSTLFGLWAVWGIALCLFPETGEAKIYTWTDKSGQRHYTDNPANIPAHFQPQSDASPPPSELQPAPPPASRPPSQPAARPASAPAIEPGSADRLRQQAKKLEEQIAVANKDRQGYLEQIESVRRAQTNPAFGRRRRRTDQWGRDLAAVEQRLDKLRHELDQVREQLRQIETSQQTASAPEKSRPLPVLDSQGHTRDYWSRRVKLISTRLEQARSQRQRILNQLNSQPQGAFGRRGAEVLRLSRELEKHEQEIVSAKAELQALQQAAAQAGAPAEWLR